MTTYTLTARPDKYPHSQMVAQTPVRTVSAVFSGPDATTFKGSAIATTNVFELISIPAGAFVLSVAYKVTTVEGGTCTFGIGDGAGTSGYASAIDGNTSADAQSFNGTTTPTFGVGKYYAAADTVDLILSTGTAAAVVVKISVSYIQTAPLTN